MKDIIRQAVADAAEWLYQNRAAASSAWFLRVDGEVIIKAQKKAAEYDARSLRADQIAEAYCARPRIDSVLIIGPSGEMARTGGFVDRAVIVRAPFVRRETADAAEYLWTRAPLHYSAGFLMKASGRAIRAEAGRDRVEYVPRNDTITIPRAALERLADPADDKALAEAITALLTYL